MKTHCGSVVSRSQHFHPMWFGSEYVNETFIVHTVTIMLPTPASHVSWLFFFNVFICHNYVRVEVSTAPAVQPLHVQICPRGGFR